MPCHGKTLRGLSGTVFIDLSLDLAGCDWAFRLAIGTLCAIMGLTLRSHRVIGQNGRLNVNEVKYFYSSKPAVCLDHTF